MPDSLGTLVDRLTVTNLKLWFVQDAIHQAAKRATGVDADTTQRLVSLNLERNRLMTEIDQCFQDGLAAGKTQVEARVKIF